MTATTYGFYVPGQGWLYRLDPRVKLWLALLCVVLAVLAPRLGVLIGLLGLGQALLLVGGVPSRQLARVWRNLGPLVGVILVLQPLLAPGSGPVLWQIGPLRITTAGLLTGLHYGLRVSAAAFAVLIPVLTTPTTTLVRAFQKLGLPYTWAMTIGLALRYLGTMGELYTTISEAQQARGWDPSGGSLLKRVRSAVPTLVALIVASLRLSDTLALGLAARGFGLNSGHIRPTRGRTYLRDLSMQRIDWAAFAFITGLFGAALLLSF